MKRWKSNLKQRRKPRAVGQNKPPVGSRPGTLVIPAGSPAPRIRVTRFTSAEVWDQELRDARDLRKLLDQGGTGWVDVQGLGDREVLETIGRVFGLHPLILSDVVHVPQRPKSEGYDGVTFTIARRLAWKEDGLEERQVSLVFGANYVLTFQEGPDDVLEPVRNRLLGGTGLMRRSGPDYLAYAILDTLVDGYFPVIDQLGERLHRLEERVIECPTRAVLSELQALRGELIAVRRDVWPQREALQGLLRGDVGSVSEPVRIYLRDCHDHCVQIAEVVEVYRELASGLLNLYLTSIANRTNEVMKVLTVVATIFIPLTFLVGVYGMNFRRMPELAWPWAYPALWILMLGMGVAMLFYFRRKGWLGKPPE